MRLAQLADSRLASDLPLSLSFLVATDLIQALFFRLLGAQLHFVQNLRQRIFRLARWFVGPNRRPEDSRVAFDSQAEELGCHLIISWRPTTGFFGLGG